MANDKIDSAGMVASLEAAIARKEQKEFECRVSADGNRFRKATTMIDDTPGGWRALVRKDDLSFSLSILIAQRVQDGNVYVTRIAAPDPTTFDDTTIIFGLPVRVAVNEQDSTPWQMTHSDGSWDVTDPRPPFRT